MVVLRRHICLVRNVSMIVENEDSNGASANISIIVIIRMVMVMMGMVMRHLG